VRALIVCYAFPPEPAPGGVMARELAEDLAKAGHEVTVITGFPNHPEGKLYPGWKRRWRDIDNTRPFRLVRTWHTISRSKRIAPRGLFYLTFALSCLLNGVLLGRFDLVYCDSTPIVGAVTCWMLAVAKRAALVYGIFDMYPEAIVDAGLLSPGLVSDALLWMDCFVCRRADRNMVISEGFRQRLIQRGLPDESVVILPMWVDRDDIHPQDRLNAWREEQGIPDEAFVCLFAGTIGLVSGAQVLVEVAELLADDPDVIMLFVGQGLAKDEAQRAAEQTGLENMLFLDFQPREHLSEVQATADVSLVTLLPGKGRNSVPSKVISYMAAARPIVASVDEDSDTARWIDEAGCGIVVPPQDAQAIAEAIRELRADEAPARELGERGRESFAARYSRESATREYEVLFRDVLEERLMRRTRASGGKE